MKKVNLLICSVLFSSAMMAQFKMETKTTIGQVLTVNNTTGATEFDVSFNTDKALSTITGDVAPYTITIQKCGTDRGVQVKVFDVDGTTEKVCGDFKCNNFGSYSNPVHVESVASLQSILTGYVANGNTANTPLLPAHCLFDQTSTDQAFGAYPGQYKKVEYGFYYNFTGFKVNSDITFDIDTYFEGQNLNGAKASYTLTVYIGGTAELNLKATVADFYVSGSGKKSVSLASATGLDVSAFSNNKVYFYLKTAGSGTDIAETTIDPIIVFDDMFVNYNQPVWVAPAAGSQANLTLDNSTAPFSGTLNQESLVSMNLKLTGRYGAFNITNDRADFYTKQITFLETGGIKANDGNGNYTVDVPYTFTVGSATVKDKMVIAAPASGSVDDDIMIFFNVKPNTATASSNSLEFDCGVRIWYNYYSLGSAATAVSNDLVKGLDIFSINGFIVVKNAAGVVAVKNICGQTVSIVAADVAVKGIAVTPGIYLVTTGNQTTKVIVK